jgi:hypothetical protein
LEHVLTGVGVAQAFRRVFETFGCPAPLYFCSPSLRRQRVKPTIARQRDFDLASDTCRAGLSPLVAFAF